MFVIIMFIFNNTKRIKALELINSEGKGLIQQELQDVTKGLGELRR